MTNSNIFAYSIDVAGLFEHPSTIEQALRPANLVDFKWVANTEANQVWVFYQFATSKDLKEYSKTFKRTDRVRKMNLSDEQINAWV